MSLILSSPFQQEEKKKKKRVYVTRLRALPQQCRRLSVLCWNKTLIVKAFAAVQNINFEKIPHLPLFSKVRCGT